MRLVNLATGEAVRGRCRATNLCDYCARLFAVETSEMLLLDAMEAAPTLLVVLTARELLSRPDCYGHLRQLRRALRKRWPSIEWAVLVEFQRRGALHLNLLVKGVDVDQADELHAAASRVWCSRVDALPVAQSVTPVYEVGGAVRYVSQHFMKPAQAPPRGWRGHRYSSTRGYLARPASVMREEARRSLQGKRALHRQLQDGLAAHDAELAAHEAVEAAQAASWALVHLDLRSAPVDRSHRPAPPPDQSIRARPSRLSSVGGGLSAAAAQTAAPLERQGGLTADRRAPQSRSGGGADRPSGPSGLAGILLLSSSGTVGVGDPGTSPLRL